MSSGRRRLAGELAGLLASLARAARIPTAIAMALPVAPGVFLLVLAVLADGAFAIVAAVLGAVALLLTLWLWIRRRQLLAAIDPVDALADDLAHAADAVGAWKDGEVALARIQELSAQGRGPITVLRILWTGLRFGQQLLERVTERPRLAPFTPPRPQGLVMLVVSCTIAAGVALVVAVVGVVLLATGVAT